MGMTEHILKMKSHMDEPLQINRWVLYRIGTLCVFGGSVLTFVFLLLGTL